MELKIPSSIAGIDMGQSLIKIDSREKDEIVLYTLATEQYSNKLEDFLEKNKHLYSHLNLTGGKCYDLLMKFQQSIPITLLKEFDANLKGIEFLHKLYKKKRHNKSLLTCLGTGTSIVLQENGESHHLGGSALGGGFFMGMVNLLYDITDFTMAVQSSAKGNRYNVDLKVSDIYDRRDDRIDLIFREFTAASLGKIPTLIKKENVHQEDVIASLTCMIAENIGSLAAQYAECHNVKNIVFLGGLLENNKLLKNTLSLLCKIYNKKAIFLKNSLHTGALGALFS
ncbi:MAG: hypothetical protein ACTSYC_06710 [Promethearchaeota archaeon]